MSGENVTLDAENKKDAAVDQMKHDLGAGIRLQSGQALGDRFRFRTVTSRWIWKLPA